MSNTDANANGNADINANGNANWHADRDTNCYGNSHANAWIRYRLGQLAVGSVPAGLVISELGDLTVC